MNSRTKTAKFHYIYFTTVWRLHGRSDFAPIHTFFFSLDRLHALKINSLN